jgi:Zn-dependent M28 family amino/carboxypeptidase
MTARLLLALFVAASFTACASPAPPAGGDTPTTAANPAAETPEQAAAWWKHVAFLAHDEMRGRETGSPEHRKAANYVAEALADAGVQPGGGNGYLQPVTFRSRRIDEARSSLALVRRGKAAPVVLGDEAAFGMRIDAAPAVEAPLVFAGHGLVIPETGHDDFAGLDVKGKVVVYISGSPRSVPGALSAHYQSAGERWATLKRLGAVGTISVANPKAMDVPWERSAANRLNPAMALADASLDETAGQQLSVAFNPARAERLFEGSGHTFAEVLKVADEGKALPHFPLAGAVRATVAVESQNVESQNVVGIVRGRDPALADEFVVLTAHLDHVGIGAAIDGDAIYNGAMDNASGIATLLESARAIAAARPKRSVVFVAVTAEEKGLLGSRYFALHPTVAKDGIVANINMDMFLPLFPLKTLMVLGLDESDLGDDVRAVTTAMNVGVQADPEPQRNRFIRSDQYSFIREGVPALAMKVGYEEGSPEAKIAADWTRERYHAPSDDLEQPIDRGAAFDFTKMVGELCVRVANRETRPQWKEASFFKRFAKPATTATTTERAGAR